MAKFEGYKDIYVFVEQRNGEIANVGYELISEARNACLVHLPSMKVIGSKKIQLPPLELQNQFADFVKEVDKSRFIIKSMIKEGLL